MDKIVLTKAIQRFLDEQNIQPDEYEVNESGLIDVYKTVIISKIDERKPIHYIEPIVGESQIIFSTSDNRT